MHFVFAAGKLTSQSAI